jgi:UDP-N-acetyl-D-mannosaminuronic acid dehydrogenase
MSGVVVHGLGYIGLPTAAVLADSGFDVFGYDTQPDVRENLRAGEVDINEPGLEALVTDDDRSGSLTFVDEPVPGDYHVVCVPTPFDESQKRADLSYVEAAGHAISDVLRAGDTVILESTVPPGTTTGPLRDALEGGGLTAGDDFSLAHCPETVLPGRMLEELRENDRVVGGLDDRSVREVRDLYDEFVRGELVTAEDPTTAEFVKLIQNTYRDTNVALANEIARLAADYGIDSREPIALANRHPRVNIHQPGPGVGGHCLPVDPWFLGHRSDELDLVSAARRVNEGMTEFVVDVLREELDSLLTARVALLGVAYKGNVDDTRHSPGLDLAANLQARDARSTMAADGGAVTEVRLHDPHVTSDALDLHPLEDAVAGADALVLTADHDEYADLDPEEVRRLMAGDLLVDTKSHLDRDRWTAAGFTVRGI